MRRMFKASSALMHKKMMASVIDDVSVNTIAYAHFIVISYTKPNFKIYYCLFMSFVSCGFVMCYCYLGAGSTAGLIICYCYLRAGSTTRKLSTCVQHKIYLNKGLDYQSQASRLTITLSSRV